MKHLPAPVQLPDGLWTGAAYDTAARVLTPPLADTLGYRGASHSMTVPNAQRRAGERLFLSLALSLVATVGTLEILYGEKFAGHGIGKGDPRFYSWMAEDFGGVVLGERLDSYRLQRVLPSAIVSAALTLFGLPKRLDVIARAFAICNLALLLATVALWQGIARTLALSVAGRWLGFLVLFGNFACVRAAFYNPVQTDYWALALGALLLYGYVRSAASPLLLGAAAGAFTWPALPWLGAPPLPFSARIHVHRPHVTARVADGGDRLRPLPGGPGECAPSPPPWIARWRCREARTKWACMPSG